MNDESIRGRLINVLFATNGLTSTSFIAIITVAPIVAADISGSKSVAGIPSTAATVGTALGALVIGSLGARHGRRRSFGTGLAVSSIGALLAVVALLSRQFLLFAVALFVIGFGRSSSQLARYAAGDLTDERRRGAAISKVVWAATIGAIAGPVLIGPAGDAASRLGFDPNTGPIVLAVVGFALASLVVWVLLRPEPLTLAVRRPGDEVIVPKAPLGAVLGTRTVRLSVIVLITSQLVMVLVMTMTPLHIEDAGLGLQTVAWVMMAHTIGMFAFAPITGLLVDRLGTRAVMTAGGVILIASCLGAATTAGTDTPVMMATLLGLGLGWNFGFVSASTLLQHGLTMAERLRVQGIADAATWLSGGFGAATSGVVVAVGSYSVLAVAAAVLATSILLAVGSERLVAPAPV